MSRSTNTSTDAAVPVELLPLSPRDYLILLGLAGGPCHGYGLVGEIESLSGGVTSMDPANLYRAIKRLKRDGLVEDLGRQAADIEDSDGDERRRYYGLTEAGLRAVSAESLRLERLTRVARERRLVPAPEGTR